MQSNEFISDERLDEILAEMEIPPINEVVETPNEDVWEYKIISTEGSSSLEMAEEELIVMGLARWELVTIRVLSIPFENQVWYYLKRKRQGVAENG
jgi:hypothetical protein